MKRLQGRQCEDTASGLQLKGTTHDWKPSWQCEVEAQEALRSTMKVNYDLQLGNEGKRINK